MSKASNLSGFVPSIGPTNNLNVGVITATSFLGNITGTAATFTTVSIGGTLTYEDVTNVDSIGIITARSDVSIADKIIHTGDTNTAIRFPAADTFTVETAGSERVRVTSGGQVRIGSSGAPSNKNTVTPLAHVDGNGVNGALQVNRHSSVGGGGSQLLLSATRGSSITGHTVLQSGDGIGTLEFVGSDGDEFVSAARVQVQVDGTPGDNDMPGRLIFSTTADGASSPTERVRITSGGAAIFKGGLVEKFENAGTTLGSQPNNPLSDGNVILFTGNESGNKTINFTGVHSVLSSGESVSFTAIISPNGSGVINVVQVDGQAITVKWSGGSAPSAGSSGRDVYTFTILKTGTGTTNYEVYGAATNYA